MWWTGIQTKKYKSNCGDDFIDSYKAREAEVIAKQPRYKLHIREQVDGKTVCVVKRFSHLAANFKPVYHPYGSYLTMEEAKAYIEEMKQREEDRKVISEEVVDFY